MKINALKHQNDDILIVFYPITNLYSKQSAGNFEKVLSVNTDGLIFKSPSWSRGRQPEFAGFQFLKADIAIRLSVYNHEPVVR